MAWPERRFGAGPPSAEAGYDKGTLRTVATGHFALGLAATAFLHAEIGSVRGEIGSLRDQVQDNRATLVRIEAILGERLSREN